MQHSSDTRQILSVALPPLVLSAMSGAALACASGWNLGIFIGGLLLTTLLLPPILLATDRPIHRVIAFLAAVNPIALTFGIAWWRSDMWARELASSLGILIGYAIALAGFTCALRSIRLSATVSAAVAVLVGLAWLTCPIWLSRTWNGEASANWVGKLGALHPGLALNIPSLGQWAEQSVAYHLTELNQSVPYAPPHSVWMCVFLHTLIGAALLGLSVVIARRDAEVPAVHDGL